VVLKNQKPFATLATLGTLASLAKLFLIFRIDKITEDSFTTVSPGLVT
jgi:hypothetical protein